MRRIVPVRLEELYALSPAVADPAAVRGHHDMRIAAKRLRYTLEIFRFLTPAVFTPAIATVREIQDRLGLLHDLDVFMPFCERYLEHRREEQAVELGRLLFSGDTARDISSNEGSAAPGRAPRAIADVRRTLEQADGAAERRALLALVERLRTRRREAFAGFQRYWQEFAAAGFRESLYAAIGSDPPALAAAAAPPAGRVPRAAVPDRMPPAAG
jgi:CHAD domain-containing protein